MMETVNILDEAIRRLSNTKGRVLVEKLGPIHKICALAAQIGPYLLRNGILITIDDMSRAINGNEEGSQLLVLSSIRWICLEENNIGPHFALARDSGGGPENYS